MTKTKAVLPTEAVPKETVPAVLIKLPVGSSLAATVNKARAAYDPTAILRLTNTQLVSILIRLGSQALDAIEASPDTKRKTHVREALEEALVASHDATKRKS